MLGMDRMPADMYDSLVRADVPRGREQFIMNKQPTSTPRSSAVKIGVLLGAWGHWSGVLRELDASGGALRIAGIAAVREGDGDTPAPRIVAEHPCASGARIADDAASLLDDLRPDFAVVSARPDRLAPLASLAVASGCHVVSEKPLALDSASLGALRDAVAGAGVRLCAMLPNRARPALAAGVAAIRAGAVGRPVLLSARKTYKWGVRQKWFGDRAAYGGTIPWIGIHALDFIDAATGGDPAVQAMALHGNLGHPDFPGCEDVCAFAMRLRSGALATATLDYFRPDAPVAHGDDGLRVVGTRGELTIDIDRNRCVLLESGSAPRELPLPAPAAYYAPWLLALPPRGERAAPDDHTLRAFRLTAEALAIRNAADSGQFATIDWTGFDRG